MGQRYTLQKRPFKVALGSARLGAFWQGRSVADGVRTVRTAMELGIDLIDTADGYARGLSERVIGVAVRGVHERPLICTKVGQLKTPLARLAASRLAGRLTLASLAEALPRRTPDDVARVPRCYEGAYVEYALGRSLRRLRCDRVDILLLHSPALRDVTARRFEAAAARILARGDAQNFGISCDSPEVARAAAELPYVSFVELPVDVAIEDHRELVMELAARGVGVLARSPFAGGALRLHFEHRLAAFDADAQAYCLQSIANLPGVFTTIVGMSSPDRVRENLALLTRRVRADQSARFERMISPLSGKVQYEEIR